MYEILKMDKTEARAIIKCLQKKDMTSEDTLALKCYMTLLIHQSLTFICSLMSKHPFLVASLETIRVVEECLGDQGASVFCDGIAMHEHRLTEDIDVKGDYTEKSREKLS